MFVLEIFYSEEDNGYIAIIPELPGCSAFGETEGKALEEIKMAMEPWLETAKKGKKNSTTTWKRTPQDSLRGCLSHHTP